jgi:fatty acid desaturase
VRRDVPARSAELGSLGNPSGHGYRVARRAIELPTLLLCIAIYGGWISLTWFHDAVPTWVWVPALIWIVAWQSSLQHELVHGHPTRWLAVNRALGFPPLSLWLPFAVYRRTHLRHHNDTRLTDPLDDPESYYWTPDHWSAISRIGKALVRAQTTFLGRIAIGPAWNVCRFLYLECGAFLRGDRVRRRIWPQHLVGVAAVLAWVWGVCGINPLIYIFAVVYPATSLLLIRSFAEHRAAYGVTERIAVVENAPVLGLLFLYNNLHAAHHTHPGLPWYRLPAWYRQNRDRLLAANGGLVYDGYLDVARRYLLSPHDQVLHPLGRAPLPG